MKYLQDMLGQVELADARFGPFTSSHEGLGVLSEEYRELEDAIHANDAASIQREAIQVAAVALRLAQCCDGTPFLERSGCRVKDPFH